jgi:hypothetical protein
MKDEERENKASINKLRPLAETKLPIATEAAPMPKPRSPKKLVPKSVTRIGPEDECSDEEAFVEEKK